MDQASLKKQSFEDEQFREEEEIVDEESRANLMKGVFVLEVNKDSNCDEILKKDVTQQEADKRAVDGSEDDPKELAENSGESSIDSNIEILKRDEALPTDASAGDENKENLDEQSKIEIKAIYRDELDVQRDGLNEHQPLLPRENVSLSYLDRSIDRSKTSIDDLSFSQKTLIKSCSLRSLITDLINDEILLDKNELSKDLDEFEKEKFFLIIKTIKQEDSEKRIEQLKELCEYESNRRCFVAVQSSPS